MEHPVTVLGAGIVGICTALALAERGHAVRVIDRNAPGQETSYGNAGIISPWSVVPQALPGTWRQVPKLMFGRHRPLSVHYSVWPRMLAWGLRFFRCGTEDRVRRTSDAMSLLCAPSADMYRRYLVDAGADDLLKPAMYVHAFRDGSRATLDSIGYAMRREKGAEMELVGADALRRIEPTLSNEFQAAILIKGQARAMSPGRICQVLAGHAATLGVTFETAAIQSLERRNSRWAVICDEGEYLADTVVIALGVWSRDLLAKLGVAVPLMAERGYHVEYPAPRVTAQNSVMDTDAKVVASSMEGGLRVSGHAEFAPIDAPPDRRKTDMLRRVAGAMFPGLDITGEKAWMGRRPSFPDSLPAIGPVEGHDGLIANFGHSHYGLMMAPKSGQIVAAHVSGSPQNADLSPFSLKRFR
ncbi:MAG: FAD-dependent oxidoreductase [Pseudomonadota bacterium]